MKFRTKVMTGISIALVIILLIIVVDQRWKADLNESRATNDTIQQQESTDLMVDKNMEKDVEDVVNVEESSEDKGSKGNGTVDPHRDLAQESKSIAESNSTTSEPDKTKDELSVSEANKGESSASEANKDKSSAPDANKGNSSSEVNKEEPKTSTGKQPSGLYFATREEAMAFSFSRFSAEEIQIYNKVSANGLTPKEEELALQVAYSRFSAAEIAAIEDALNR